MTPQQRLEFAVTEGMETSSEKEQAAWMTPPGTCGVEDERSTAQSLPYLQKK